MRQTFMRPGYPQTLPYSHAVVVSGRLAFLAGQGPVDPATGQLVGGDFEAQARLTLDNLAAVAAVAGGTLAQAVKVNAYLADMGDFARFNEIYREYFPADRPARTTVQSDLPNMLIEVDAVLALDAG
jgi:2-iminobutanoate/2-iminopropanoate deaminase